MSKQLRVNPILCEAHGVCAELLPELISLDRWGYPVLAAGPVPPDLESLARRAVASCPALALLLERSPATAGSGRSGLIAFAVPRHRRTRSSWVSAISG
jgi:ferredoxin